MLTTGIQVIQQGAHANDSIEGLRTKTLISNMVGLTKNTVHCCNVSIHVQQILNTNIYNIWGCLLKCCN